MSPKRSSPEKEPQADEARSASAIMEREIEQGLSELRRPFQGLSVSGLSAGLDVSFGVLLMATALTRLDGVVPEGALRLIVGNLYAIGFIFVIVGRSELFTEHTTRAVFPILAGKAGLGQLARLWGIIWLSNLVGATLFASFAAALGPTLGFAEVHAFDTLAVELVEPSWYLILGSAVLAGWLMGLLSWLVAAARDTMGQLAIVWLVTSAIGMLGLHHCIVGTAEVMTAVFAGDTVTLPDFGHFLLWSTLGNVFGGTVFVALIKFGHVSAPGPETDGEGKS
ncbi:MAG: formate/nitrite transporter family protein [Gemmatimonadota bacterium]